MASGGVDRLTGVVPRAHPNRLENLVRGKAQVIAIESEQLSSEIDRYAVCLSL